MDPATLRKPREPANPLKHLLRDYTTSHPLRSPSPLPASSRVDPKLTQRLPPSASNPLFWTIPTWIAFVRFAVAKGIYVIWSLVKHFLMGPVRKSWGYRMTFVSILIAAHLTGRSRRSCEMSRTIPAWPTLS